MEVDIASFVYTHVLCVTENDRKRNSGQRVAGQEGLLVMTREVGKRNIFRGMGGVVMAYLYNLEGIEWIISTSP